MYSESVSCIRLHYTSMRFSNVVPFLILLVLIGRGLRERGKIGLAGVYAAGLLLGLTPSLVHNLSHGVLSPVSVNGGYNFFLGNHREATGAHGDPLGLTGVIEDQTAELDAAVAADLSLIPTPPRDRRIYFLRIARATDLQSEVLPTPGGPTRQRIGPLIFFTWACTARYSMILSLGFLRP